MEYQKLSMKQTPSGAVEATCVKRLYDNAFIPFDPSNTDAIEFCKWLKDGNVPEPAVEGETVSAEWISETIAKLTKE